MTTDREVVAALEQAIVQRIGEPRYTLWFANRTRFRWDEDRLVVGVPNRHFQEWLQSKFANAVSEAACAVIGRPVPVQFTIDAELFQVERRKQQEVRDNNLLTEKHPAPGASDQSAAKEPDAVTPSSAPSRCRKRPRRWRRLGDFVVGSCNRVPHAAAVNVVEQPGQEGNPLVLHGPVGTGKTHLLEGIYVGLRKSLPDWRVCFATAEDFTNRFVQAMRLGKLVAFRKYFREADALLVDDLHFLAGKRATQEEFLHTFDVLQSDGKQLVVTCDCHPRLAEDFTPELTDRLLGGAIWGLGPPDAETRLGILQSRALRDSVPAMSDEVLRHLAAHLRGNVRELEGALHAVRHYSRVTGRPIDLDLAREALADLLRHAVRVVQLADVEAAVCCVLRLETNALQSKERGWAVSHPRMLAMYLARKHTAAAYSEVGRFFGGRNHSTAVAAEKKVRQWLDADGELVLGERRLRVREILERVERELLR